MSRHRNIRKLSFGEDDDDDVYGSVEDNYCISPGTVAQFTYDRGQGKHDLSTYLRTEEDHPLEEISEENGVTEEVPQMDEPELQFYEPIIDSIKVNSCVEEIQNVIGNSISEALIRDVVKKHECNFQLALDEILTSVSNYKPVIKIKQTITLENPTNTASTSIISSTNKSSKENSIKSFEGPSEKTQESASNKDTSSQIIKSKTDEELLSEYNKARGKEKPLLNLVVIGHVDAGKSTLMGHLLFKLGNVSKKLMHKYKQESQKIGKSSFVYAWVLDETEEERSRGITTEVGQTQLETDNRTINLLDAPGHKDFIPYMITGASQADVAILVVDATKGEFETGFEAGGQTREHTLLIRSLGVSQLAVAVNKLDNVNWSKERFDEIVKKLSNFLKQAGFNAVVFVPCSGLQGVNLTEPSNIEEFKSWYSGPCLLNVIDNFKPPERLVTKPFRLCINDVFKGMTSGMSIAGKVEAGMVQMGNKLLLMPNGETATAKTIMINDSPVSQAFAGDFVTLILSGVDQNMLVAGAVLCDPQQPIRSSTRIQARVVTFNLEVPLTQGFEVVLHYQNVSEQAFVHKIRSQLNKSTGEVIKKHPRFLPKNASGIMDLEVARPICVELYKDFKELGRVMLRINGSTIATGLITKIY